MQLSRRKKVHKLSGSNGGGATPVPIPNTEVKPSSADGTAPVTVWESRSLPEAFFVRRTLPVTREGNEGPSIELKEEAQLATAWSNRR
jgi:hypothetical protein